MSGRRITVLRDPLPGSAALDTAASREILDEVARGERPETLRLWRPGDALAFSVLDRTLEGFPEAVAAARAAGFEPFLRLAGGHAAVYAPEVLAFAWAIPAPDPRIGVAARFDEVAGLVAEALHALGIEARIGPVPGEYCPGGHSVNARGRVKLMGVGQRVVRGAAYVGGAIVAGGSTRLRGVLAPVYAALRLRFDPEALGSVEDERAGTAPDEVALALLAALAHRHELLPGSLDPELLVRAKLGEARYTIA